MSSKAWINKLPSGLITVSSLVFAIAFFGFGRDLIFATKALFVASLITAILFIGLFRKVYIKRTEWGTVGVTLLFTGLTIFLDNEYFILWRSTITSGIIGLGLIVLYFLKKTPLEAILGRPLELTLPKEEWVKVNLIWGIYMLVCALLNAIFVLAFSHETWVLMKTFVIPGLSFVFMLGLFAYLFQKDKAYKKIEKENKLN